MKSFMDEQRGIYNNALRDLKMFEKDVNLDLLKAKAKKRY